jgi:hypothetical protein
MGNACFQPKAIAGHYGTVKAKVLPADVIPPILTMDPKDNESERDNVSSSEFWQVNTITDNEVSIDRPF